MIFGYLFSTLRVPSSSFLLQQRPDLWHLDFLCVREKENFSSKKGAFALSGKGVEVHIFSTGLSEHTFIQSRISYIYGGVDTVGRGTEIACVVGGHEVGIARECSFFSYAITTDAEFVEAVDAFFDYKLSSSIIPTIIIVDVEKAPTYENKQISYLNNEVELAIKRLTDLNYIVLVPAGDGYYRGDQFFAPLNAFVVSPARLTTVVTVGACEFDYSPAVFSNYGSAVNVIAPGCGIVTGTIGNRKAAISGTRMAVACVAGIAVEFLQQNKKAIKKDFDFFIRHNFFTTGLTEYLDYYLLHDPVYNPDEQDNFAEFWYGTSYPYNYRFALTDTYALAHCPYLKSVIAVENIQLPDVLACVSFTLQINAESKTKYNENKPLFFKLVSTPPSWLSLEIGERSGKLFGMSKNVPTTIPCSIEVDISDGLYSLTKTFTFNVLTNPKELKVIGSQIRTVFEDATVLDLQKLKQVELLLDVKHLPQPKIKATLPLQRNVILLQKTTGMFIAKVQTNSVGEFMFYVPDGVYQALVIDEHFVYNVTVLNNLRT